MGPGKRATRAERAHMLRCKESVCILCLTRVMAGILPARWAVVGHDGTRGLYLGLLEYDHHVETVRKGHMYGWAACIWHHRGRPQNGMSERACRDRWGVAKTDGAKLFTATYGTADELIELQAAVIAHYHPERSTP